MSKNVKKIKITDYFERNITPKKIPEEKGNLIPFNNDFQLSSDKQMNRLSDVLKDDNLVDLLNEDETYIYYRYPYVKNSVPIPLTKEDDFSVPLNDVELPFQENTTVFYKGILYNKWSLVNKMFSEEKIENIFQFDKAIKTCNPSLKDVHFDILINYIQYQLNDDERKTFFDQLLPNIIRLALDLPRFFYYNLANLDQGTTIAIFLSQQQISSLIANAFLCTYNSKNLKHRCINFASLFSTNGCKENKKFCKLEKLKCLINYLRRVTERIPIGTVSIERKVLISQPSLEQSTKPIRNFEFNYDQCLIKDGCDYSQVDFAHKYIGGGVLDAGCVQEEILFVICPELIVCKLLCEKLLNNEAVIITGVEQFNTSIGYADKFKWQTSYMDKPNMDKYGRRFRQILAMDAMYFHWKAKSTQYELKNINRELFKAMSAFQNERFLLEKHRLPAVATGNWGCGVYNGDPYLKTIIQIIAASQMDRNLKYFTYDNKNLKNDFDHIKLLLETSEQTFTVGLFYQLLIEFANEKKQSSKVDLVDFITRKMNSFSKS